MHVCHFEEPGRINRDVTVRSNFWMPTDTYSMVLDTIVLTCVDIFFVHQGRTLLGKRNRYPKKGWWIIGGRMFAGESPDGAVQRKAKEEAGLEIGRSRIQFFGLYSTCFATRHQPPVDHGLHSVNLAHLVEISDEENDQIQLTNTEYDEWTWVSQSEMTAFLKLDQVFDGALHQMLADCWNALDQHDR